MRICSPQLGISPNSVLGGEVFDREILLGLAKEEIDIEIIMPQNKAVDKGVKHWYLTFVPITHFPAFLFNFLEIPYLSFIYLKRPFKIIRIHSPRYIGLGAIFFKIFFAPQVKLVATYHQFREANFLFLSKVINNYWDHIICDSENVKRLLNISYGVPIKKITVVHNGVPKYLKPIAKNKLLLKKMKIERKIILLFMGQFVERKNPLFLLKVLENLNNKDVVLLFWGQGPLKEKIIDEGKKIGLFNQIRIVKPAFEKEKNKIHSLADIFVHPSKDEGFALAPLEAMACGKPILMSEAHSALEAIDDGKNGYICKLEDIKDWTNTLKKLIESKKLRERMGKESLRKVKKSFQWQEAVKKHVEAFAKL